MGAPDTFPVQSPPIASGELQPRSHATSTTQPSVRPAFVLGDRGHGAEAARVGSRRVRCSCALRRTLKQQLGAWNDASRIDRSLTRLRCRCVPCDRRSVSLFLTHSAPMVVRLATRASRHGSSTSWARLGAPPTDDCGSAWRTASSHAVRRRTTARPQFSPALVCRQGLLSAPNHFRASHMADLDPWSPCSACCVTAMKLILSLTLILSFVTPPVFGVFGIGEGTCASCLGTTMGRNDAAQRQSSIVHPARNRPRHERNDTLRPSQWTE